MSETCTGAQENLMTLASVLYTHVYKALQENKYLIICGQNALRQQNILYDNYDKCAMPLATRQL